MDLSSCFPGVYHGQLTNNHTKTFTVHEAYKDQIAGLFALRIDMQNDNVINRRGYIFMSMFGSFYTYCLQFLFLHTICVLVVACDFFDKTSQLQYECMRFLLTVFMVFSKIYFHGLSAICLHGLLTDLLHLLYGFLQCLWYVCRLTVNRFIKKQRLI